MPSRVSNSPHRTIDDRLWKRIERSDSAPGRWLWTGAVNSKGYGLATRARIPGLKGRAPRGYAHRIAWEETHGPIPDGMQIDHVCRVRRCINPAHLRIATPTQNQENRVVQVRHQHIGSFRTLSDAVNAAREARRQLMPFSPEASAL